MKLYRNPLSGHCHRVELFLSILGQPVEFIDLDMGNGAHLKPDYLALHPFGQVPAIDDNGTAVWDSTAILVYLARKYDKSGRWMPEEKAVEIQQWLSIASHLLANGPAAARLVTVFGANVDHERAKTIAHRLFEGLDKELAGRAFLTGDEATIADIAFYAYTAHAPEGEVSLEPYANIRAWLKRVEALDGFVPMPKTAVGLAA
ncbi:glutathione S-transferase family protein [Stappia albiluteola]|uniref:glutathione S-transferase family protein n=1 Tax=Stappia albiluteola TaxID=2758565 RepID=UPI002E280AE5|nr:glutathione S-transferase [Stappia albiluteola]